MCSPASGRKTGRGRRFPDVRRSERDQQPGIERRVRRAYCLPVRAPAWSILHLATAQLLCTAHMRFPTVWRNIKTVHHDCKKCNRILSPAEQSDFSESYRPEHVLAFRCAAINVATRKERLACYSFVEKPDGGGNARHFIRLLHDGRAVKLVGELRLFSIASGEDEGDIPLHQRLRDRQAILIA